MNQDNPQTALADLVVGTTYADLPPDAIAKTKIFLLDSLGVALAGSSGPQAASVTRTVAGWGTGGARVWLSGERLPAPHAAMVNAYLIHCMEFDCVHEGAVVHPMATILSAALAHAETHPVRGCELITALAIGVDIAASLGMAANGPLRFFRPATAGAFGATAAVAKLAGFDHATTVSALGMVYGQISGTLQPHLEGSVLLPLQIGCNARAALNACDLAAAGLVGPKEAISGRYGYFALFEDDDFDLEPIRALSGPSATKPWRITALSHKPFPSGRLTHGVVDGLARLQAEHGFASHDVARIIARVPPLVHRLVGRPDVATPDAAYARLCLAFVAGVQLARGRVDVPDFQGEALADPDIHDYARRVEVVVDDTPDPNALVPQTVQVVLQDGRTLEIVLAQVLGHPAAPLSAAQNIEKFRRCCGYAARPLEEAKVDALIATVDALEDVDNVARLVDLMSA